MSAGQISFAKRPGGKRRPYTTNATSGPASSQSDTAPLLFAPGFFRQIQPLGAAPALGRARRRVRLVVGVIRIIVRVVTVVLARAGGHLVEHDAHDGHL